MYNSSDWSSLSYDGDHTPFNKRRGFGILEASLELSEGVKLTIKYSGFWKDDDMDTSLSQKKPEDGQDQTSQEQLASLVVSLVDSDEAPDQIFLFKGIVAQNKFEGKG